MTESTTPRVLILGGGVAALETLIALRDLAGDRVAITLLAPETDFTYRPIAEVRADEKIVRCTSGRTVAYDHLVIAVGAKATPSYPHAITFGDDP